MPRRPNKVTERAPAGSVLEFRREEYCLKHNYPGPSGVLGGYQKCENYLVAQTDPVTLLCPITPTQQEQVIRYCQNYGKGGPNGRIRRTCIPALRRLGIHISPLGPTMPAPPTEQRGFV